MSLTPELTPKEIAETQEIFNRYKAAARLGLREECHQLLWANANNIRRYLYSFELVGSDSSFIKPYVDDALARFFRTIDLLVDNGVCGKILEIGGNPYLMTILIRKLTDYDITITNFFSLSVYDKDVGKGRQTIRSKLFGEEYDFDFMTLNIELSDYPFQDNQFDKILFCEVLEHIVVDPLNVFGKLKRVLKPGGELILTTLNAVRLINFAHILAGKNFFDRYHPQNGIYGRHNREFTLSEVTLLLKSEGFTIKTAMTLDRYNYDECDMYVDSYDEQKKLPWTGAQLREILSSIDSNVDLENRGDNVYIVAEKNHS